jgi:hypothetical protein
MHQWVASYPSITFSLEGSPNAVTSSQSVVDIVPTHCAQKQNIQVVHIILFHFFLLIQIPFGSKIAFHSDKVVHHHGYIQPPQISDGSAVTHGLTPTSTRWFGRHARTHAYVHLLRIQLLERARAAPCISKTPFLTIRCNSTSK